MLFNYTHFPISSRFNISINCIQISKQFTNMAHVGTCKLYYKSVSNLIKFNKFSLYFYPIPGMYIGIDMIKIL